MDWAKYLEIKNIAKAVENGIANVNPRAGLAALSAGLIAPAFISNDDRGYFASATLTTPLIAAAFGAAPGITNVIKKDAPKFQNLVRFSSEAIKDNPVSYTDIKSLRTDLEGGKISRRHFNDSLGKFIGIQSTRKSNVSGRIEQLTSQVNKVFGNPVYLREVENLTHRTAMDHLPANELASYIKYLEGLDFNTPAGKGVFRGVAPQEGFDKLRVLIDKQLATKNEPFIKAMTSGLQKIEKTTYKRSTLVGERLVRNFRGVMETNENIRYGEQGFINMPALQSRNPKAFAALERQLEHKTIDLGDLQGIYKTGANGEESIIALRVKDQLNIPIPDSNNMVLGGTFWDRQGQTRQAITANGVFDPAEWALNSLGLGEKRYFDIQEDLNRLSIYKGADLTSDWQGSSLADWENVDKGSALQRNLRTSRGVQVNTSFKDGRDLSELHPYETEAFVDTADTFGLTKAGPEKMTGTWEFKSVEQLNPHGVQDPFKQNPLFAGLTKDVSIGNLPSTKASTPYSVTSYLEEMAEGEQIPMVGAKLGGVPAHQIGFFEALPSETKDLAGFEETALGLLQKNFNSDRTQAQVQWKEFSKWLSNPKNLRAAKLVGSTLGEGGFLGVDGLHGTSIIRNHTYELDELALDLTDKMYGKTLEKNRSLGFVGGMSITTGDTDHVFESAAVNERGTISVNTREVLGWDGAKLYTDAAGKGQFTGRSKDEIDRARQALNKFGNITDTGTPFHSETEIFGAYGTTVGKGNANYALTNLTNSALRNAEEMGMYDIIEEFKPKLNELGFELRQGDLANSSQLVYDSKRFAGSSAVESANRFKLHEKITSDLFEQVGTRIKKLALTNPMQLNETGRRFGSVAGRHSFQEYMMGAEMPINVTVGGHASLINIQEVRTTPDLFQQLNISGHDAVQKALLNRIDYVDGDPAMTRQFGEYIAGNKTAITKKISMREALGGRASMVDLTTAEGRAGTIYDPGHELAKENFLVEAADGTLIPMLGHDAYGGKINRFDGKFSPTIHERASKNLFDGLEKNKPLEEIKGLQDTYTESLLPKLVGKDSFVRPNGVDRSAVGGTFVSRSSPLKYADGSVNPNVTFLSTNLVEKLPEAERTKLLNGEAVASLISRHPIKHPALGIAMHDPSLGVNQIGADPSLLASDLAGDTDGDLGYVHVFDREKEPEAFNEIIDQIGDNSRQRRASLLEANVNSEAIDELSRNGGPEIKSLTSRIEKLAGNAINPIKIRKGKLISNLTGQYSNFHDILMMGLEGSSSGFNPEETDRLNRLFFPIKQSTISAIKHENAAEIGIEGAAKLVQRAIHSFDTGANFEEFNRNLGNLYQFAPPEAMEEFNRSKDLLERYHAGRPENLLEMASSKTSNVSNKVGNARNVRKSGREAAFVKADINQALKYADSFKHAGGTTSREASTGARMASEAIGAVNETITSARNISKAFNGSKANKILGVGLGIAALAGFATTTTSSPRSLNKYRPEETSSTSGHVPGDSGQGSYSSNPPRTRVSQNTTNVSRAMVAPIGQSTDTEVTMKTDDPQRATEVSKMVARSSGAGNTTVTNNYKNNNLTSLRNKQKLRERLAE